MRRGRCDRVTRKKLHDELLQIIAWVDPIDDVVEPDSEPTKTVDEPTPEPGPSSDEPSMRTSAGSKFAAADAYGQASVTGMSAQASLALRLTTKLQLRAGISFLRIAMDFDGRPDDRPGRR